MKKSAFKSLSCTLAVAACLFLFTGCGGDNISDPEATSKPVAETIQNTSGVTMENANIDSTDLYADWENDEYTSIVFYGSAIDVNGSGVSDNGSILIINDAGTYVLSGTLDNGTVLVAAEDDDDVRIVLNGVSISCSDGAPFFVQSADKVIISLPDGTINTLSDGTNYTYDYYDEQEAEPSAALFSKDDLVINGSGKLTVNGNCNDAIASKDSIKITGGTLILNALDDGLVGKDMVAIEDVNLTIDAGGDGIKSTNDSEDGLGFIAIKHGQFTITSGADAIQAQTCLYVEGGAFDIQCGGGSGVSSTDSDNWRIWGGKGGENHQMPDTDDTSDGTSSSAKALKAVMEISLAGGTFAIDSSDDALHSNGTIEIVGGSFSIASGDDGIHADTSIFIANGDILITKSYEGIESTLVEISGGSIDLTSSDDGINISGGSDSSSQGGRPGQNDFNSSGGDSLNISGGTITVNASGDGLDSNGSIYISGGAVFVSGPTNSGNGSLDYGGVFELTGGTLVSVGSVGMAEVPSSGTTQYTIAGSLSSSQSANTAVSLVDKDGNEILSFTAAKTYQHVIFSSPGIVKGQTYAICVDGDRVQEVTTSGIVTAFNLENTRNGGRP